MSFVDLDVMAVGPVVSDIVNDFERYWQSESARSADSVLGRARAASVREVIAASEKILQQPAAVAYVGALQSCAFVHDLLTGAVDYRWASARLVSDDPAKGLGRQRPRGTLLERLLDTLSVPQRELQLISPYLVPTRSGERALVELAARRREGLDPDECTGGDRRADRARRLREAPTQDAQSRRRSL